MADIAYDYRPKPFFMFLCTAFLCLIDYFLFNHALQNQREVTVYHLIRLSAHQATILLWIIFSVIALFTIGTTIGTINGLISKAALRLTQTALIMPHGFIGSKTVIIPYIEITRISAAKMDSEVFLNIYHLYGKVSIWSNMMQSKTMFEDVLAQLIARTDSKLYHGESKTHYLNGASHLNASASGKGIRKRKPSCGLASNPRCR